jgi:hypothetical protein
MGNDLLCSCYLIFMVDVCKKPKRQIRISGQWLYPDHHFFVEYLLITILGQSGLGPMFSKEGGHVKPKE